MYVPSLCKKASKLFLFSNLSFGIGTSFNKWENRDPKINAILKLQQESFYCHMPFFKKKKLLLLLLLSFIFIVLSLLSLFLSCFLGKKFLLFCLSNTYVQIVTNIRICIPLALWYQYANYFRFKMHMIS